jgi:hypothetical protein
MILVTLTEGRAHDFVGRKWVRSSVGLLVYMYIKSELHQH